MNQEAKVFLGIGIATLVILLGGVFLLGKSSPPTPTSETPRADQKILVREDSNKIGSSSAKAVLVEFGDFQCPACAQAQPITKKIIENYKDQLLFVSRNFPLPQHANAIPAAQSAEAAGAQGKYWEMFDKLYENQKQWSESNKALEIFERYAKDLGLDVDKFKQDVQNNKFAEKIQKDQKDGNALGINSTPTFYLNGEKLNGISYDDLRKRIDAINTAP